MDQLNATNSQLLYTDSHDPFLAEVSLCSAHFCFSSVPPHDVLTGIDALLVHLPIHCMQICNPNDTHSRLEWVATVHHQVHKPFDSHSMTSGALSKSASQISPQSNSQNKIDWWSKQFNEMRHSSIFAVLLDVHSVFLSYRDTASVKGSLRAERMHCSASWCFMNTSTFHNFGVVVFVRRHSLS